MLNAIQYFPCIRRKTDWTRKWIGDDSSSFATRLVSFAIVKVLFFNISFASIFCLKKKNILPGSCLSNDYVLRDESLHVAHVVMLYGKLQNKLSHKDFNEIIEEAVDIEIEYITLAIPCRMIGMSSILMISISNLLRIDYVCNWVITRYTVTKILYFMESISLDLKTNMFRHGLLSISYHNPYPNRIFENLCHQIMFGRDN